MSGLLSHSPARVLAQLLIAKGQGSDPAGSGAWPVRTDTEVSSPDNVITLKDTIGSDDGRDGFGSRVEHPGVQITVRAADETTCYAKAQSIAVCLDGAESDITAIYQDEVAVGTHTYCVHSTTRKGNVVTLGYQPGTRRCKATVNCLIALNQLT